ncbi:MAG: tetratricopeptide repeat protein [Spirulinaceae cyanobacterium]
MGREKELETLHTKLCQGEGVAISAVAGMGGVGKTELATQYVKRYQDVYGGGVCWFDVRVNDLATAVVEFIQLNLGLEIPQKNSQGQPLDILQQVRWCWQHWQPEQGKVLLVVDDVGKETKLQEVLPQNKRFSLLLTTRVRNLSPSFTEMPLNVLSLEKAEELLIKLLGKQRVTQEAATARELLAWLGYLPLGIELVGWYLREDPSLSLQEMGELLQEEGLGCEAVDRSINGTAERGVRAAFELSWAKLDTEAKDLAMFMGLFAPALLPWELVKEAAESHLSWSKGSLNQGKRQLYQRHLIQFDEKENGYKVHALIRVFCQEKLAASVQKEAFATAFAEAMVAIAKTIPQTPTLKDIQRVKAAIPHLKEVPSKHLDVVADDEDLIWSFLGLARFYEGQGLYKLAEPYYQQCWVEVETRLGEEHPHVASSLNNLAGLHESQGRYTEAEPLYKQALELRKRLLGEEHPDVATSLNNLAGLYKSQGRYTEAEPLYKQALELRKRLLGEEHPDVASSLNNLALLYKSQGKYTEAELLYQQALELCEQVLGSNHPNTVTIRNNLAYLQEEMRK